MPLTDAQIDRYSRQIIVPNIGGRAQESLLAARLLMLGEYADVECALAYLVGAGVGHIELAYDRTGPDRTALIDGMRSLNQDSSIVVTDPKTISPDGSQLVFAIIGSDAARGCARSIISRSTHLRSIVIRIDSPPRLGVFPAPTPCPFCADGLLNLPVGVRAPQAGAISMMATAEAFKLLAGLSAPQSSLIEFDGYASRTAQVIARPDCRCAGGHR